jgi:hypothetical protein
VAELEERLDVDLAKVRGEEVWAEVKNGGWGGRMAVGDEGEMGELRTDALQESGQDVERGRAESVEGQGGEGGEMRGCFGDEGCEEDGGSGTGERERGEERERREKGKP